MKTLTAEELVSRYEESGKRMYAAQLSGDFKTNNREWKKMTALFKQMENDLQLADACLPRLLASENVVVQAYAASYCLALKRNIEAAVKCLEQITREHSDGESRFTAEKTLEVWRTTGELKVY